MTKPATEIVKHTEASVLTLLRKRHAPKNDATAEWAYMEHVRNAAGFDATRTADAMALSLWKSRGHELHGFEVKVARSDWKKELDDPAKAEVWTDIVDRWWVVAPKGVVLKDEVPSTWGYLEVNAAGTKIAQVIPAPLLTTQRHDIQRSLLVCLLRSAGAALGVTPEEAAKQAAYKEGWQKGHDAGMLRSGSWKQLYEESKQETDLARRAVKEIESALGVSIRSYREKDIDRARHVAKTLKMVLDSEVWVSQQTQRIEQAAEYLEGSARHIRESLRLANESMDRD